MAHKKRKGSNPLSVIALFTAMVEASALASLPFLDDNSQTIYIWFLVGFPTFLAALFFATLNFNYKALYSPSDFETSADFLKGMEHEPDTQKLPKSLLWKLEGHELLIIDSASGTSPQLIANQLQRLAVARDARQSRAPALILIVGQVAPPMIDGALSQRLRERGFQVATTFLDRSHWQLKFI